MVSLAKRIARRLLGRAHGPRPMEGAEIAARYKAEGRMTIGENCSISPRANITDPDYVVLGNNVRLSDCHLFGHDGSVNMVNRMAGTAYDAVGKIVMGDNVFVGHGTHVMPGTTIGDNVIIGSMSKVSGHVASDGVYDGNPLVKLRTMDEHLAILARRNAKYPWSEMIVQRGATFDPVMEPKLVAARREFFFAPAG